MNPFLSRNGGPPKQYQGESSEIIIDETLRFIDQARQDKKPFFTVVWFGSPHEPYSGLKKDLDLYKNLPKKYRQQTAKLTSMKTGRPVTRPLNEVLQERYAEITAMDRAIGKLRNYLKGNRLRQNTLVWYCGDNGVPGGVHVTTPFRGHKGQMYEGGIRVPGIIEWPKRIAKPRVSAMNSVTSDMLPTICDIIGQPVPDRPLDGISLRPLIDGKMSERKSPICFWSFNTGREAGRGLKPYIEPQLQEGTTPLVKFLGGRRTRNFRNLHHPKITDQDFAGPRVILDGRYKLVVDAGNKSAKELFDLRADKAEQKNLIEDKPDVARKLEQDLRNWQQSVLTSLTAPKYK